MKGNILAVIGGQYGSEGKGNLVAAIAHDYNVHVRVGGPNAGHSFKSGDGRVWKMQSIPCGWVNPSATLVIGAGALISIEQLYEEWRDINAAHPDLDITRRLKIDRRAGIISPWHKNEAGGVEGEAHQRYGSTGEGVGVARIARLQRRPGKSDYGFYRAGDLPDVFLPDDFVDAWHQMLDEDTVEVLHEYHRAGEHILLEGTQGSGLSIIFGPWPYTSNHDSNAAQLAADCGLAPRMVNRCLLVIRTMPIRVAGNSGPLENEVSWKEVSDRIGKETIEKTTVTKKTRRIGEWDEALVRRAVQLNQPTSLGINFLDYLSPEDEGKRLYGDLSDRSKGFVGYAESTFGVPAVMLGTGGEDWNTIHRSWIPL